MLGFGKYNTESAASTLSGAVLQFCLIVFAELSGQKQTEPGAFGRRGEERFENLIGRFTIDSRAVVTHRQAHPARIVMVDDNLDLL